MEQQKLMQAMYGDAIPFDLLKQEQTRIQHEKAEAERAPGRGQRHFHRVQQAIDQALDLAADLAGAYMRASDRIRRLFNQSLFEALYITDDRISGGKLTEPFATLLGRDMAERAETAATEDQVIFSGVGSNRRV